MFVFLNSISKRLFFSFGILVFNIILITFLALFFQWRSTGINEIAHNIDNQRILMINLIKTDLDFLRFETVNTDYFLTGNSPLLRERDSLLALIWKGLSNINAYDVIQPDVYFDIERKLTAYNNTFQELRRKINERGFKDHGVEGAMRKFAHNLEDNGRGIALADLLTLRRHEKDFILRKESTYVHKFNTLAERMVADLQQKGHDYPAAILMRYKTEFNLLVALNVEIGITPSSGLLEQLNSQKEAISADFQRLTALSNATRDKIVSESVVYFASVSVFLIIVSLLLTYYTSVRLARPIKKLSVSMGNFMVNEGLDERDLENGQITDEVGTLAQSFVTLSRKLKTQFQEILYQNTELRKLNAELDRFIYSAAHDLRSPLTSLLGLIQLAELEINSQKHAHYFSMMNNSVKKLDGFIRDITDFAKNKRQQLKVEGVDLSVMICEILESMKFLPHGDRIKVMLSIEGEESFTDRARLEIILRNLLSNCFRYLDVAKTENFVWIEIVVAPAEMRLKLKDNGIGIRSEHLHRIFDMFYRAVEFSQGTGIGLFLVKESVKMLRGKISVRSVLGEFTTFYLNLPNLRDGAINAPENEEVIWEASRAE